MRQSAFGLQPEAISSASCEKSSIGPPPDWGIDMAVRFRLEFTDATGVAPLRPSQDTPRDVTQASFFGK
jgi:hypothetical protein